MLRTSHTRAAGRRRALVAVAGLAATSIWVGPLAGTPGPAAAAPTTAVYDDLEHGAPLDNGWFAFGGSVGGGGIAATADVPPTDGGSFALETGWGSGGAPGFYGGFGRGNPTDTTGTQYFNFWIDPIAGQEYTLEINLQDDAVGDGALDDDDEFQFDCVVGAAGPCAVAGGGWQLVSIPLADFWDDNSFRTGGNGVLDPIVANIVVAVIGSGTDANFDTDYWAFSDVPLAEPSTVVDDFESGLPAGTDADGVGVGFLTFSDGSPVSIATTDTAPADTRPGAATGNSVLALTGDVASFAGFVHAFENATADTWVPQDWSSYQGIRFWLYGLGNGTTLFVDVIDNRNAGSTTDDAERFSVAFVDDVAGWRQIELPFADFTRKEIGNGAPNDGFTLTRVHGWALGTLNTPGEVTYHVDDVELYGVAEIPELAVTFTASRYDVVEGTTGQVVVKLNRPMNADDPAQVTVGYRTEPAIAEPGREYAPVNGTLTFVNGGPSQLTFPVETFDDTKWEGDERIGLRLTDFVDVAPGFATQASVFVLENDPFDDDLLDDFEQTPYLWDTGGDVAIASVDVAAGDALARPDQDAHEGMLRVDGPIAVDIAVKGRVCGKDRWGRPDHSRGRGGVVPVVIYGTPDFDATAVDWRSVTFGGAPEAHTKRRRGWPVRHAIDVNRDGDRDLVVHFRVADITEPCDGELTLNGRMVDGRAITSGGAEASFGRDFAIGQDWTHAEALTFWYHGTGSGEDVTVHLQDNRAPDPGPAGWSLVWADEFDDPAGTPPNPEHWSYEIGDVTPDGKNGWGNDELQYYTDDAANAATDGDGNMVLTVREADGSLQCYYGPCEYTSARLISLDKAEFAYGRIESRIQVPEGAGIWPAFWSLGTDIDRVGWPQTGEIDIMEFVGRLPDEIFGTIHGPGYAGGQSLGNVYDFGAPVPAEAHTYTVEWEPDLIRWYVDGILYHTATPADVAPNEWVFNDPVYLLLNVAMGGNFGGAVADDFNAPQSMKVDYVRVYQGPDTAERFESSFTDDFVGWQEVTVPLAGFERSATQPAGAPDDGLTLTDVWGYGFSLPNGLGGGTTLIDRVRLEPFPPPTELVVTSSADAGDGTLRDAVDRIATGGTITFDPALAGATVPLSGPIAPPTSVTIDASGAPGLTLDGGGADRVLVVDPGVSVRVVELGLANGYGYQLGGCVLNNGDLTLDRSTVSGCVMTTDAGDFWQGGGGVYTGEGATLHLVDSVVTGNSSGHDGGGVYGFLGSTTVVERSTISDNVAANVGGGLRLLGDATVTGSTISANVSTAWHGGALFLTDGVLDVVDSSITGNSAPGNAAIFVGTFGDGSATMNIVGSEVTANDLYACFLAPFGAGAVAINSLGGNVFQDDSCGPVAGDIVASP